MTLTAPHFGIQHVPYALYNGLVLQLKTDIEKPSPITVPEGLDIDEDILSSGAPRGSLLKHIIETNRADLFEQLQTEGKIDPDKLEQYIPALQKAAQMINQHVEWYRHLFTAFKLAGVDSDSLPNLNLYA